MPPDTRYPGLARRSLPRFPGGWAPLGPGIVWMASSASIPAGCATRTRAWRRWNRYLGVDALIGVGGNLLAHLFAGLSAADRRRVHGPHDR